MPDLKSVSKKGVARRLNCVTASKFLSTFGGENMKKLLVGVVLCLSAVAFAADAEFNVDQCLDNAQSNNDMKACVYQEYRLQDKKLNEAYKSLVKQIKAGDPEYSKEILNRVVSAQKAWIKLRDTTCAVEGIDMLGGSGEGLVVGGCLGRLTKERVQYLVELKKHLSGELDQ